MQELISIDVTLRDGGNRINFDFHENDLAAILPQLDKSGVEYIEIGYRNGAIRPVPNIGLAGLCAKQYVLTCSSYIRQAKMAVMGHPENITIADLLELQNCGVALFRVCVTKHNLESACAVILAGKQLGLKMSANIIHVSQYHEDSLQQTVNQLLKSAPDMLYFADSNGSLSPQRVTSICNRYSSQCNSSLGFHAHDNIGLAQANAMAAIAAGVAYIDFSLAGFGKGGGNLKTELFCAYLHSQGVHKYDLSPLLAAANFVRARFTTERETLEMDELLRGILDLSTAEVKAKLSNSIEEKANA